LEASAVISAGKVESSVFVDCGGHRRADKAGLIDGDRSRLSTFALEELVTRRADLWLFVLAERQCQLEIIKHTHRHRQGVFFFFSDSADKED